MRNRENGADFYGLPRNEDYIELEKKEWTYELEGAIIF